MAETKEDIVIYDQLLSSSQKALARGYYQTAYHALAAALHVAVEMKDSQRLEEVAREADHQLDHVNTHAPDDVMSSSAAEARVAGVDMFSALSRIATVRARMFSKSE